MLRRKDSIDLAQNGLLSRPSVLKDKGKASAIQVDNSEELAYGGVRFAAM